MEMRSDPRGGQRLVKGECSKVVARPLDLLQLWWLFVRLYWVYLQVLGVGSHQDGEVSVSLPYQRSPLKVQIIWNRWTCFRIAMQGPRGPVERTGGIEVWPSPVADKTTAGNIDSNEDRIDSKSPSYPNTRGGSITNKESREEGRAAKETDCRGYAYMRRNENIKVFCQPRSGGPITLTLP
jgi:hypothetical protein